MPALKLHYDGWVKLPAALLRSFGARTGDTLEILPGEGGTLVLRAGSSTARAAAEVPARPVPARPAAVPEVEETPAPRRRGRPKKVVTSTATAAAAVLPPSLRVAAGRRKTRPTQPMA
jgi:hypothetical protein